eukprot:m.150164 g.150164  ORF g.150164 m.150164 type:complete len:197 (-) comp10141_c0_seq7:137-727(-)
MSGGMHLCAIGLSVSDEHIVDNFIRRRVWLRCVVDSFGVTLCEVWSGGQLPYEGQSDSQVWKSVTQKRGFPSRPERMPLKIYGILKRCWHYVPTSRPSFQELLVEIAALAAQQPAQFPDVPMTLLPRKQKDVPMRHRADGDGTARHNLRPDRQGPHREARQPPPARSPAHLDGSPDLIVERSVYFPNPAYDASSQV